MQRRSQLAELEAYNRTLENRDRILAATAEASNILLTEADFDTAVNAALQILGESVGCDRIAVGQQFDDSTGETLGFVRFLYEWDATGISPQFFETEGSQDFDWKEMGLASWFNASLRGEAFGQMLDELPEPFRQTQEAVGVQSTHSVPIFVGDQFWGVFGIDHCREKRLLSETELVVFKTAANCIGNAIERDRTRQTRETAEREAIIVRERAARAAELEAANQVLVVRDRWLETTAIAANQLLSSSDVAASVNDVLQMIGENLECDRLAVMRYLPDFGTHPLGAMQMLHEWDAAGISAQINDPDFHTISAEGGEAWFAGLMAGEWVGGEVADLPEPVRSGQQHLGVLSTYAVPIFVEDRLWGVMAMDHCREVRRLGAAEIAVFRTAATCVGSAIYQERVRRDQAAQERAKLLGSVAEVANLLLKSEIMMRFAGGDEAVG